MIVADSTVWIDFLNDHEAPHSRELDQLIREARQVLLTDHVLTEVLQGYRAKSAADEICQYLLGFPFLGLEGPADYISAADLFRTARSAGITLRNLADILIAVPCIREGAFLLHNDRDFYNLASVSDLKIWKPTV